MGRKLSKEYLPLGATAYVHKGEIYVVGDGGQPTNVNGQPVELPDDFPTDAELAAVAKRAQGPGSQMPPLTKNAAGAGAEDEDYESMTKDELADLAAKRGIEVTRGDGEEGKPVKADYVAALGKGKSK